MAMKKYSQTAVSNWVTLGGFNDKINEKNPTSIEGYLVKKVVSPSTFDEGKFKTTYIIRTPEGDKGVNGTTNLNMQFEDLEAELSATGGTLMGARIKFTYTGSRPSKKGAPTKLFEIQYDSEDTTDLDADSDTTELPVGNNVVAAATADRRAQVEALLKKAGNSKSKN